MPPQVVLTPSSMYWRWLSSVRNAISLLWSVGKMKFEAWPVEPPGLGSGPLSSSTISVQPELGEVAGQAVADDAGADDHALGAGGDVSHGDSPRDLAAWWSASRHGDISLTYHRSDMSISLSARAYQQIRRMIIRLELAPGDVVREDELQRQLGIGRTPIREALQRLAREQFVTVMPRRGMFVSRSTCPSCRCCSRRGR